FRGHRGDPSRRDHHPAGRAERTAGPRHRRSSLCSRDRADPAHRRRAGPAPQPCRSPGLFGRLARLGRVADLASPPDLPTSGEEHWPKKQEPRACTRGLLVRFLDDANGLRAWPLGARLDFEGNLLATLQPVEVALDAAAVEEELLTVFGCDKPEATVRDQFLDGACGHFHLLFLELKAYSTGGPVRENGACA